MTMTMTTQISSNSNRLKISDLLIQKVNIIYSFLESDEDKPLPYKNAKPEEPAPK
jgi:hypothetical protein